MKKVGNYFWNILIGLDQLLNTVLGGYPDETISSRIGKLHRADPTSPFPRLACWFFGLFDENHCIDAIEDDEGN